MARSMMMLEGGTKPDPPELMKTGSVNVVNSAGSSRYHVLICSDFMLRTFLLDEGFAIPVPQSSPAILEHLYIMQRDLFNIGDCEPRKIKAPLLGIISSWYLFMFLTCPDHGMMIYV